ncbi:MAG: hypothetical protein JOZ81_03235 [Chloroflexi bacterium]|nr:hypothetical protein [Chloroflexota bacterium]
MPGASDRPRGRRKAQTLGMTLAVLLGTAAVGLAVLGTTQKQVQIGLILGLWAALIGLITLFGIRRRTEPAVIRRVGPVDDRAGRELQLRSEAANRLEYEKHLQALVRSEIGRAVQNEMDTLRSEVAALRSDLVEKVHGQLQLERIETTRVIGSDLEALQHEVRRLAVAGNVLAAGRPALGYRAPALDAQDLPLAPAEPALAADTQATTLLPRMGAVSRAASASFAPSATTSPSPAAGPGKGVAPSSNGTLGPDDGIRWSPSLPPAPAAAPDTPEQVGRLAPRLPAERGDRGLPSAAAAPLPSTPGLPSPASPAPGSVTPATPPPAWPPVAEKDPFDALPRLGRFVVDDADLPPADDRTQQVDVPVPAPLTRADYVGRRRAVDNDSEGLLRRYDLPAAD